MDQVTVIGAGTMGRGIAQAASMAGYRVVLSDVSVEALASGIAAIRTHLEKGVALGKVAPGEDERILGRIRTDSDSGSAVDGSFLVIEAVPEDLDLKKRVFARVEPRARADAVFATNTSALPVTEIGASTRRPERFVGMHFFNPAHIMKLLEVVRSDATSDATLRTALEVGGRMGKECIVVRDVPGFATSRLGVLLGLEAMRMVEQGVASARDIDSAMTLGYKHPVGPLKLSDMVGLDVRLSIAEHLHRSLGSEAFRPPEILKKLVGAGSLGRKTGRGFYEWPEEGDSQG